METTGSTPTDIYRVVFMSFGKWSQPYHYRSRMDLKRGDVVLVPTGKFYGVGVVCGKEADDFTPSFELKFILRKYSKEELDAEQKRLSDSLRD